MIEKRTYYTARYNGPAIKIWAYGLKFPRHVERHYRLTKEQADALRDARQILDGRSRRTFTVFERSEEVEVTPEPVPDEQGFKHDGTDLQRLLNTAGTPLAELCKRKNIEPVTASLRGLKRALREWAYRHPDGPQEATNILIRDVDEILGRNQPKKSPLAEVTEKVAETAREVVDKITKPRKPRTPKKVAAKKPDSPKKTTPATKRGGRKSKGGKKK